MTNILASWATYQLSLCKRTVGWVSHVRKLFKYTPRYFTMFFEWILRLLTLKLRCLVFAWCLCLKIRTSVLPPLRDNLLPQIRWSRCFKSWFENLLTFFQGFLTNRRFVSAAKWCTELWIIDLLGSFM